MSKTTDKPREMTELKWLNEGYVLKKGAEGRLVYYQKIREYIRLYSRSEVVHREDWAKARLDKRRKAKNKKARERYRETQIIRETCAIIRQKKYEIVTVRVLSSFYDWHEQQYYDGYRYYDYIADDTEQFEAIEIGQKMTVPTETDEMEVEVIEKRVDVLAYIGCSADFIYKYRTINGIRVQSYTEEEYKAAEQKVKDAFNRRMRKRRQNRKEV